MGKVAPAFLRVMAFGSSALIVWGRQRVIPPQRRAIEIVFQSRETVRFRGGTQGALIDQNAMTVEDIFGPVSVEQVRLPDGDVLLRSRVTLGQFAERVTDPLVAWAAREPERAFIAQRNASDSGWETLTYGEALRRARAVGQFLLNAGCGRAAPTMIVASNSIDHACFALGALYAGVPVAPISPAYAAIPAALDKLEKCVRTLNPTVVFLDDMPAQGQALRKTCPDALYVCAHDEPGTRCLSSIWDTPASSVETANAAVTGDTIAKYLFTSGSTDAPKAVVNTQRMLCSNQRQFSHIYPFVARTPPVLVDWLPWHHTFGGNEVFFLVMFNGGTLYVDRGRPTSSGIEETVRNLREIHPTIHFNVPVGFDLLAARMANDLVLRASFFERVQMLFYSGAGMPQQTWSALEALSIAERDRAIGVVTAWGATETAPLATGVHYPSRRADNIGVPVPGCEIKLAMADGRRELRVRGPNVTPGYLGEPELSARAFDADGFYCTGDAGTLADETNPNAGIIFQGRIAEDFKLSSGTWVSVGLLRGLLSGALMPAARDVVIAGADRNCLCALVFLNVDAAQRIANSDESLAALASHSAVITWVSTRIILHNGENGSSSMRIERLVILPDEPSSEAGEVTDKGSVSQAAVLRNRSVLIDEVYAGRPSSFHVVESHGTRYTHT